MRRWRRALIAGFVLPVALTACADAGGLPAAGPSGLPPGTQLADWLVSPPGTVVLGSPFPDPDGGFAALLLVIGRPLTAVRDVLRQATDEGFTAPTYGGQEPPAACWTRSGDDWADGEARPVGGTPPADTRWLTCEVNAAAPATPQGHRRLSVNLIVGSGDRPYLSHLYLREHRVPGHDLPRTSGTAGLRVGVRGPGGASAPAPIGRLVPPPAPSATSGRLVRPPAPPATSQRPLPAIPADAADFDPPRYPSALPGPGQRLAERFAPGREVYRVLDGSQLAGPEFPSACATGGFHAVLRLDDATMDGYDDMARAAAFNGMDRADAEPDQTFRYGDGTATYRAYHAPGGGDLVLVAVSRPNGPTFLLISRCND